MTEIKWQEPPEPKTGRAAKHQWDEIAATLKKNPGRWALVQEGARNGGGGRRCAERGLEWRQVSRADGKFDIYAKAVAE